MTARELRSPCLDEDKPTTNIASANFNEEPFKIYYANHLIDS